MHIQSILIWEFTNNKILIEPARKFSNVYGQGVITDCQARNSFSKFHSSNMSLGDKPRPEDYQDVLRDLVKRKSIRELALDYRNLKIMRNVSQQSISVLHTLCKKNKEDHISIAASHLSRQRNDSFLKNIITGDENGSFMCMVEPPQYFSFWILKPQSFT